MARNPHVNSEWGHPLRWPPGEPRTPRHKRERRRPFTSTRDQARRRLTDELRKMGARYVVISTDVPLRNDGEMRASAREPDDPGVAAYFDYHGETCVIACDRWELLRENLHALALTVAALRGLDRWGATTLAKRAIQGSFARLPPVGHDWRSVLGFGPNDAPGLDEVKARYRTLARDAHPDRSGSPHEMMRLNDAMEAAASELAE